MQIYGIINSTMRIFKKKSSYPIGLDISDLGFKLAQLDKTKTLPAVQALGKSEIDKNIINQGIINDQEAAAKAIKKICYKPQVGSFSTDEVVACLPETKTFIKLIEIEKGANPISEIIGSEIERYVPLERKQVYYDYQIISQDDQSYSVLIGAAPRQIVDNYIEMLRMSGLSPVAFEIEPVALARALLNEEMPDFSENRKKTYGIIDIGAIRSSFVVYSANTITFSISIPISGEGITKKIAETLKIDQEQAEKSKIVCGLDKSKAKGIVHDVLNESMQQLIDRINDGFEYQNTHYADYGTVEKMIICGGGANIKNLDNILSQELGIEVELGDAFANISQTSDDFSKHFTETHKLDEKNITSEAISVEQNTSLNYATAIGLALRNIYTDKI